MGVESNLRRLEIKVQMDGLECLDLNTLVGGSLLENEKCMCSFDLMALFKRRWGWRGIYSLHLNSNRHTLLTQIGDTEPKAQLDRPV